MPQLGPENSKIETGIEGDAITWNVRMTFATRKVILREVNRARERAAEALARVDSPQARLDVANFMNTAEIVEAVLACVVSWEGVTDSGGVPVIWQEDLKDRISGDHLSDLALGAVEVALEGSPFVKRSSPLSDERASTASEQTSTTPPSTPDCTTSSASDTDGPQP